MPTTRELEEIARTDPNRKVILNPPKTNTAGWKNRAAKRREASAPVETTIRQWSLLYRAKGFTVADFVENSAE